MAFRQLFKFDRFSIGRGGINVVTFVDQDNFVSFDIQGSLGNFYISCKYPLTSTEINAGGVCIYGDGSIFIIVQCDRMAAE